MRCKWIVMFYPLALSLSSFYIILLSPCNKFLFTLSLRVQIKIKFFSFYLSFLSPVLYFSVFPKSKTDVKSRNSREFWYAMLLSLLLLICVSKHLVRLKVIQCFIIWKILQTVKKRQQTVSEILLSAISLKTECCEQNSMQ